MKILAFESSSLSASVALTEDECLIAQSFQNCGLTHSRTLLPMAESLLANCGIPFSDIDLIAAAHGPGSFTGVRIGVATVKGLALSTDKPCVGVSTFEAMAYGVRFLEGRLCCVMDARAGQVYNAMFELDGEKPVRLCDDRAIKLELLKKEFDKEPYFLVGDGALMCYNKLNDDWPMLKLVPQELRFPTGCGVALAALGYARKGETLSAQQLDAKYLRRPQAESELEAKRNAR